MLESTQYAHINLRIISYRTLALKRTPVAEKRARYQIMFAKYILSLISVFFSFLLKLFLVAVKSRRRKKLKMSAAW